MMAGPLRSLAPLVRAEILKVRTTRSFLAVVGLAAVLEIVLRTLQVALLDDRQAAEVANLIGALKPTITMAAAAAAVGSLVSTPDWRHATLVPTVQVAPDRSRLALAKGIVALLAGVVAGVVVVVPAVASASLFLPAGEPSVSAAQIAGIAAGSVVGFALLALIGASIGLAVPGTAVTYTIIGLAVFVVPLATQFLSTSIYRLTPSGAADGLALQAQATAGIVHPAAGFLVLALEAAVCAGIAYRRFARAEIG